jgi:hypothetical protein
VYRLTSALSPVQMSPYVSEEPCRASRFFARPAPDRESFSRERQQLEPVAWLDGAYLPSFTCSPDPTAPAGPQPAERRSGSRTSRSSTGAGTGRRSVLPRGAFVRRSLPVAAVHTRASARLCCTSPRCRRAGCRRSAPNDARNPRHRRRGGPRLDAGDPAAPRGPSSTSDGPGSFDASPGRAGAHPRVHRQRSQLEQRPVPRAQPVEVLLACVPVPTWPAAGLVAAVARVLTSTPNVELIEFEELGTWPW